ncbi:MAG: DNA-binding response regulator [Candidatus Melainabacteria bacterium]|nr:MAG: DNA-binding response regulator [Candidatus Melainabacteria bacterium]
MAELTKILLVDDNPKFLEDVLPFYGYEVKCAHNGVECLDILNSDELFDLVLLDIMMPKMDGWETLKNIRKTPICKDIPVIMLTAVNEDQKMVTGLKIGADDYIVKPFVLPNLLARIEAVLRRSRTIQNKSQKSNVTINQINQFNSLTRREKDVLLLVTQGENNKSIAEKLVVSEITVKSHLNNIFKKLNVSNRTQAVLLAMQMNLVEK